MIEIDPDRCVGCGRCTQVCPTGAIRLSNAPDLQARLDRLKGAIENLKFRLDQLQKRM
ncbi:hypothetical protein DRP53_08000 [candidate division WOR-3 bacterium]|uniref:4Fe-4S ferredoxin-type domain-containing protein n=1 Tax=candidate division WOR-3 bacterium TaxID=2052148 RepID=A0A660SFC9_UNCW3|nr:MAG: hypothetical protein DRP53_08000 [candidate division WOR-3 bacterium]